MRIPKTELGERQLAKEIILEIVRASDGKFDGKSRLFKAFLIAHLFHFRDHDKVLSNWPIVHMPKGHGIDDGDDLLKELADEGLIAVSSQLNGPFPEACYKLIGSSRKSTLTAEARRAIKKTVKFIKNKSATDLSDLIHEKSRSYKEGASGHELNIYIDLMDDDEFEERRTRLRAVSQAVDNVFGS